MNIQCLHVAISSSRKTKDSLDHICPLFFQESDQVTTDMWVFVNISSLVT